MKILSLLIVVAILTKSCNEKNTPSVSPMPTSEKITYLALGDSYTIGESVGENERFPIQLSDSLKTKNLSVTQTRIIARTGWTTDELTAAINASNLTADSTFSLVTLLIGVNNQYRGRSVEPYKTEFSALLNRAIQFAGGKKERVIVVSIPDYAYTPFGKSKVEISNGIDIYNEAKATITRQMGIAYVNITPISREGITDPALVAADGLHPSGKQYSRWVGLILPQALKALGL